MVEKTFHSLAQKLNGEKKDVTLKPENIKPEPNPNTCNVLKSNKETQGPKS